MASRLVEFSRSRSRGNEGYRIFLTKNMNIGLVTSILLLLKTVSLLLVTVDVDDKTGAPLLRTDGKVFIIS